MNNDDLSNLMDLIHTLESAGFEGGVTLDNPTAGIETATLAHIEDKGWRVTYLA